METDYDAGSSSGIWSVVLTLSLLVLLYAGLYYKRRSNSNSRLPPGPRGLPLLGNLLSLDPELHSYFAGLAHTHGPIYKLRLGTKLAVVVTSPSLARQVLKDLITGGTDTSSNTIEFAISEAMNKPEVLETIDQELDDVVGKDIIVEESHIHRLPYLYAVMKETLRLHPVLPLLIPHCPSETCTVGGYIIPKGSRVFANVWEIHRDSCSWENPLEFDPTRFLDSEWDYSGSDFRYFLFGSGRRICAGIAMAERMVMHSLATLLHSFDWKMPQGEKSDLSEKFGIVLKKKVPLVDIPTPRLSNLTVYE